MERVAWYPTSPILIEAMLDMAEVEADDVLIDLGSGDGRIVLAAAKRGIKCAIGIENDVELIHLSMAYAQVSGLTNCMFRQQDMFEADLSEATVVTCFLDREPHRQLLRTFANLRPGTRIISNTFHLWEHAAERTVDGVREFHTARMWVS